MSSGEILLHQKIPHLCTRLRDMFLESHCNFEWTSNVLKCGTSSVLWAHVLVYNIKNEASDDFHTRLVPFVLLEALVILKSPLLSSKREQSERGHDWEVLWDLISSLPFAKCNQSHIQFYPLASLQDCFTKIKDSSVFFKKCNKSCLQCLLAPSFYEPVLSWRSLLHSILQK